MFYRFRFFRQAEALHLPSAEKEEVRRELQGFMQMHPVRVGTPIGRGRQKIHLLKPALAFAAILLLVGAGTASAAEGALPDNVPLYFIKTAINEPIRRTLARTPQAKAEVETKLATRRLEETEALAKKGKLTIRRQERVEERLVQQIEKAQERLNDLQEKKESPATERLKAKLNTSLELHERILDELDQAQSSTRRSIAPSVRRLREKEVSHERERAQKKRDKQTKEEDHQDASESAR